VTRGTIVAAIGVVVAAIALAWTLFVGLPRRIQTRVPQTTPVSAATPAAPPLASGRKIKAHLYYVADDGAHLSSVERDVAYGEGTLAQAREIVSAQIAPVAEPLVSAVPAGTTIRGLFLTGNGEAFVDLSREVASAHTGGSLNELLTIYAIVNALTGNLPAVTSVQLLVDGKEVDTLVGHVDLRRPLSGNPALVLTPTADKKN
jgi:spore germination protein GerM